MTGSSVAGIITACATMFLAIGGVITAIGVLLPILRGTKEIHKIVNQEKTDRDNFNRALVRALNEHGIEVPIDQSIREEKAP